MNNKMLVKVDLISKPYNYKRVFDDYVFLKIEAENYKVTPHPLYWQLNGSAGFLEIGIENQTGCLLSVQVITFLDRLRPLDNSFRNTIKEIGIPCFSGYLWEWRSDPYDTKQYYFTMEDEFHIEYNSSVLRLVFKEENDLYRTKLPQGDLYCEFNSSNELCSIILESLSPEEMKAIDSYISYQPKLEKVNIEK